MRLTKAMQKSTVDGRDPGAGNDWFFPRIRHLMGLHGGRRKHFMKPTHPRRAGWRYGFAPLMLVAMAAGLA